DGSTVGFDWSFWDASLATTGAGRAPTRESHRYASWYSVEEPSARASTHRNWTIASGRLSTKEYAVPRPKCGPTALESRSTAWRYFSMALGYSLLARKASPSALSRSTGERSCETDGAETGACWQAAPRTSA